MSIKTAFSIPAAKPSADNDNEVSADIDTILAATEKILAINKGLAEPDERDSLEYRKVYTPDKLFAERIDLDADKIFRKTVRRISKTRNLNSIGAAHWDPYVEGLIVGNSLSSPLEEINPIHLVEQARRITQMGVGGLPSEDSISVESQNTHPSQFGFVSSVETPESSLAGVDTRLAWGTKIGTDGRIYQRMLDRRLGRHRWVSPSDVSGKVVGLPD